MSKQALLLELVKIDEQLLAMRNERPTKFVKAHKVQQDFFNSCKPTQVVIGGNWTGKSESVYIKLAAIMSDMYDDIVGDEFKGQYPKPPFNVWIVADPNVMEAVTQPRLRHYLPEGYVVMTLRKRDWACDWMWELQNGTKIKFISHSEDPKTLEGPTVDIALFDEPPPEGIYKAVMSRLRGKIKMKIMCFTPLKASAYLREQIYGNDVNIDDIDIFEMPVWHNVECLAGLKVEYLERMNKPISLSVETHPEGCRCNGGFKTLTEMTAYINQFKGDELEARMWGKWMFMQRVRFPSFNYEVHTFDPDKEYGYKNGYPEKGNMYVALDPHTARPDTILWAVVKPDNQIDIVDEEPSFYEGDFKGRAFTEITNYYRHTIVVAKKIVEKNKKIGLPISAMKMDPYMGNQHIRDRGSTTVVMDFNKALLKCVKDDPTYPTFSVYYYDKESIGKVAHGERNINDKLHYNSDMPISINNRPEIRISRKCYNLIRAMQNYRTKQTKGDDELKATSEKPEEKFKDMIDTLRYIIISVRKYADPFDDSANVRNTNTLCKTY